MSRRTILITIFSLAAALLLGAGGLYLAGRGEQPPGAPRGGDFALASADGPVSLAGLHGKVVLVYFGYASCPDICPTSLALTTMALNALTPDELGRVQVIFVSVDPNRDTPAKLKQYAAHFHPNIIGVTGTPAVLDEVIARYGGSYRMQAVESATGYVVDHTSITSVVAPDGRLAEQLPHGASPNEIALAIRRALGK